jgi:hypothetical protein
MPVELENSALKVSSTAPPVKAAPASAPVVSDLLSQIDK